MDSGNSELLYLYHRYLSVGIASFVCFRTIRKALLKRFRTGKQNIDCGCACLFFFRDSGIHNRPLTACHDPLDDDSDNVSLMLHVLGP